MASCILREKLYAGCRLSVCVAGPGSLLDVDELPVAETLDGADGLVTAALGGPWLARAGSERAGWWACAAAGGGLIG